MFRCFGYIDEGSMFFIDRTILVFFVVERVFVIRNWVFIKFICLFFSSVFIRSVVNIIEIVFIIFSFVLFRGVFNRIFFYSFFSCLFLIFLIFFTFL